MPKKERKPMNPVVKILVRIGSDEVKMHLEEMRQNEKNEYRRILYQGLEGFCDVVKENPEEARDALIGFINWLTKDD